MSEELKISQRLKVWSAAGMSVTLSADTLGQISEYVKGGEEAFEKAMKTYKKSQRNYVYSMILCLVVVPVILWVSP